MISVILLMFAAGIGLSQAVSDPQQVTLRWLRLGGIIAISLLAVAAVLDLFADMQTRYVTWKQLLFPGIMCVLQLMATQLAKRKFQRVAAAGLFVSAVATATNPLLNTLTFQTESARVA